ncbi:MAG: phage terminase large subunit family protein [Chloroflexi bacterium]|nr:phage terminase large subunit family protein [Chloroflexota bacterium]
MALAGVDTKRQLVAGLVERQRRRAARHGQPIDLLTWAAVHRRMLKPDVKFNLTNHLYLAEIYGSSARNKVIYKAGQMGASEYAISYALHACSERKATTLYVFPTDRHVSDFSKSRFGPAIESSQHLQKLVVEARAAGGKRGSDQVTLKRIADNFLYFRGAQVQPDGRAPQLKSIDADVLILDELDEMDPRAPAIARKRLGHSDIAETLSISTPSYVGAGIHAEWMETDQREWHVRCPHCGEWQPMSINQVVLEWDQVGRPVAWHGMLEGRAWVACRKCGKELDRLAAGEWVAMYTGRDVVGYHLTKLFSAQIQLLEIVESLKTTDETERKETFNQDLGLPYTPRGGQITDTLLDECRREYGHGPVADEETVMGVDVGAVLHVVIRGPADGETEERPQRWAGEVDTFGQVANLIKQYNTITCVVDALPETRSARAFQASQPAGLVWLAYYVGTPVGTKNVASAQWNKDEGVVNLDRTRSLDETMSRFYDKVNTLPANARSIPDYYTHLKAPVRVIETTSNGDRVAKYVESGADHLAHAENYCTVASKAANWLMW